MRVKDIGERFLNMVKMWQAPYLTVAYGSMAMKYTTAAYKDIQLPRSIWANLQ